MEDQAVPVDLVIRRPVRPSNRVKTQPQHRKVMVSLEVGRRLDAVRVMPAEKAL